MWEISILRHLLTDLLYYKYYYFLIILLGMCASCLVRSTEAYAHFFFYTLGGLCRENRAENIFSVPVSLDLAVDNCWSVPMSIWNMFCYWQAYGSCSPATQLLPTDQAEIIKWIFTWTSSACVATNRHYHLHPHRSVEPSVTTFLCILHYPGHVDRDCDAELP